MRSLKSIGQKSFGVLSSLAIAAGASAQDAVQWRVEDGGNGHWYQFDPVGRQWPNAYTVAEGRGGHMATVTSIAEQVFARAMCPSSTWLGGVQSDKSCEPDCGWTWTTGEAWGFVAWRQGEPNNLGQNEFYVALDGEFADGGWNDAPPYAVCSLLIEWSADCNSDGIVDFGQIRAGELEDANGNNIPDCCEQSTSCEPCAADIDGSGTVNAVDLAAILTVWGTDGGKYPNADIDGDGEVNGPDLAAVLSNWGSCP